jgi:hypothetical protein
VVIGYCRPATVDGHFFDSVINLLLHDKENNQRIAASIGVESGPRIARARCDVVKAFLEQTDAEWLNWFDTDMVPTPTYLDELLEVADPVERPIVGALCFAGGRTKIVPTIYTIHHDDDGKLHSETILSYPADTLIEVGGTGSACVLIHRSVFEKVLAMMEPGHPLPWYQDVIVDGKDWGEDLVFCLRARAAGARVWIHTGVKVGHRKGWTLDEAAFANYARVLDDMVDGPTQFTEETLPTVGLVPDIEELIVVGER